MAALVLAAACVLALGQGVRHVVDGGFGSGDPRLLDQALAGVIGVAALLAAATWVRFFLMMSTGERVVADLRRAVFDHVLGLEPAFFEATRTGEVVSRLTNDATLLQQLQQVPLVLQSLSGVVDDEHVTVALCFLLCGNGEAGPEGIGQIAYGDGEGVRTVMFEVSRQRAGLITELPGGFAHPFGSGGTDPELHLPASQNMRNGRL